MKGMFKCWPQCLGAIEVDARYAWGSGHGKLKLRQAGEGARLVACLQRQLESHKTGPGGAAMHRSTRGRGELSRSGIPIIPLAMLYGALFFDLGINLPFFPIWLQSNALDASQIGTVLAAPLLARLIANPIVTDIADRRGAVATSLAISASLVLVGTVVLALSSSFLPILAIVFLIGLAQGPLIALTDTYAWLRLRERVAPQRREHEYGLIRLWGSLGFIVASLAAGQALDWFQPALIVWLLAAAAALLALAAALVVRSDRRLPMAVPIEPAEPAGFWRLAMFVSGAALVQASHATYYAFSSLHWASEGRSGVEIGALWSVGVIAEIAFFALGGRLFWRLGGPVAVMLIGATGAVLRWAFMALDPGLPVLLALQALHAISFGATHLGSVAAISRFAPLRMQARAQGWLAALWAGCMAFLTAVSGFAYPLIAEGTYWLMAMVASLGFVLVAIAGRRRSAR